MRHQRQCSPTSQLEKSGKTLANWVESVGVDMGKAKDRRYPSDLSYNTSLEERIRNNVDMLKPPNVHEGSVAFMVQGLVARMTQRLIDINKSTEKDFEVFAL